MALYLIAFNDEWVPELTTNDVIERGRSGRAVIEEMKTAGVFVFSDGPYVETKEHLGGFAVVDVADDAEARYWAGRIAVAVGWAQEVHRFPHRFEEAMRAEASS